MTGDGEDEPSFDPRSWARKAAETAPAETLAAADLAESKAPGPDRRNLLLAGGGALALLAAGGGWLAWRGRGQPRTAGAAPTANAPAGALSRSMVVAGPADLTEALVGTGVAPELAALATQAATAALGGAPGELRVTLSLAPGQPPRLLRAELRRADGSGVLLQPTGDGQVGTTPLASDLNTRIKVVRGEMDAESFYSSAVAAGGDRLADLRFRQRVHLRLRLPARDQAGDVFEAAFERRVNGAGEAGRRRAAGLRVPPDPGQVARPLPLPGSGGQGAGLVRRQRIERGALADADARRGRADQLEFRPAHAPGARLHAHSQGDRLRHADRNQGLRVRRRRGGLRRRARRPWQLCQHPAQPGAGDGLRPPFRLWSRDRAGRCRAAGPGDRAVRQHLGSPRGRTCTTRCWWTAPRSTP